MKGKRDNLVGLKENVIIGRLIPAGTGLPMYRAVEVEAPDVISREAVAAREAYEAGQLLPVGTGSAMPGPESLTSQEPEAAADGGSESAI